MYVACTVTETKCQREVGSGWRVGCSKKVETSVLFSSPSIEMHLSAFMAYARFKRDPSLYEVFSLPYSPVPLGHWSNSL
jgi:hypothetical protein